MLVLRLLSLYYAYYACTMSPMPVPGLGSWPNIDQAPAPAPEQAIFKSMAPAPAPELVFRFMRSQLQSSFQGFTNVVKCNIFLAMDFTDNITKW